MNVFGLQRIVYKEYGEHIYKIDMLNHSHRFDPITIAIVGGAALAAGGQIMQGMDANQQGKDMQAQSKYNAAVEQENARAIEAKSHYDSVRQAEIASRRQSELTNAIGGSGQVAGTGTPLSLQAKQASEDTLENLMIGYNSNIEAQAHRNQATLDIAQGKMYRKAGKNAKTASLIGAGGTLLSGFATAGAFSAAKAGSGTALTSAQKGAFAAGKGPVSSSYASSLYKVKPIPTGAYSGMPLY